MSPAAAAVAPPGATAAAKKKTFRPFSLRREMRTKKKSDASRRRMLPRLGLEAAARPRVRSVKFYHKCLDLRAARRERNATGECEYLGLYRV